MRTYKEIEVTEPIPFSYIEVITEDGVISSIPKDPANSDYQRYLRWLNGEDESGTLS